MVAARTGVSDGVARNPTELAPHYRDSGFFVLRSPLLPWSVLNAWGALGSGDVAEELTAALYRERRVRLVEGLRQLFARSDVREAMFFASSRLVRKVEGWRSGEDQGGLELTLTRYLARMAGRETPFGIFAGLSLGTIGRETRLEIDGCETYRRHIRPSMGYLGRLLSEAAEREDVRRLSSYVPNSTLYRSFGRYRFNQTEAGDPTAALLDVEATPELDRALARAQGGATLEEVAAAVHPDASSAIDGFDVARQLVEHGLLVPDWFPAVTGPEPCEALSRVGARMPSLQPVQERLEGLRRSLAEADRGRVGLNLDRLRGIAEQLHDEIGGETAQHVLQADLIKPAASLVLGRDLVRRGLRAAELVQRTSAPRADPRLAEFCRRFVARYDSRMVPLVDALDEDLGIGFDHMQQRSDDALVHELGLRRATTPSPQVEASDVRLRILTRALRRGGIEYQLDPATLAEFSARKPEELPESFALVAQLALGAHGPVIVAPALIAPSGIATLSRFCHADEQLRRAVEAHVAAEQANAGERLLVDVAHLPRGESGNVLLRPVLREAEIAYGGRSGAPAAAQISVSDLYVTVVGEQIQLYSSRLRKQLSVRITNAHDFDRWWNPPVYRFLGALQRADGRALAESWSWGSLESSAFLPRIVCEDIVLSRARWQFAPEELRRILHSEPHHAFGAVQALRADLSLPRWVALWSEGTPLPVDLENPLSVEVLVQAARTASEILLEEILPAPDELAVTGPEGRFAGEIVLPFLAHGVTRGASPWPISGDLIRTTRAARSLPPGSEWLYAKVYVGASQLESVVQILAKQVVPELVRGGAVSWFFLPYGDPDFHVRLRVLCPRSSTRHSGLDRLHGALAEYLDSGVVSRLQLDTYEREVERYGGLNGVELAEEIFCLDSESCVGLMELSRDDAELRWQLTLVGIDRLYDDFSVSLELRTALVLATLGALREEFAVTTETLEKIGRKYRRYASRLAELLRQGAPASSDAPHAVAVSKAHRLWSARSAGIARVRPRLERALEKGTVGVGLPSLLHSFAHLHAVRMLGPSARVHELVLYDFLRRQYATREVMARRRPSAHSYPDSEVG